MDWTEFDSKLDEKIMNKLENLEAGKTDQEFEKVPYGKYEVVPEKLELTTSKKGNPMTVAWFRIVAGKFKNSIIFAHFVMKSSFGIHKTKMFIKSLEPSSAVKFDSFTQWDIYLKGVAEEICYNQSYVLDYGSETSKQGDVFEKYTIEDGPFEVPEDYQPSKSGENGWVEND